MTRKTVKRLRHEFYFDDHNFNIMLQTSIVRDDSSVDFNYKIPEKIGRWKAYM